MATPGPYAGSGSNTISLPAYMRKKRVNLPGPWLGGVAVLTCGPLSIAGGDSTRRIGQRLIGRSTQVVMPNAAQWTNTASGNIDSATQIMSGAGRPLAVSWYASAVSGAGPTLSLSTQTTPNAGAGAITLVTSIDLNASPSGIYYATDTAFLREQRTSYDDKIYNDPDFAHGAAGCWFRAIVGGGGQTVTDLSVVLWYFTTSHINADPAND